ncbi:MAG TPA: DNA polymerase III subunit chi [Noviherbaspirillum sp.]
MTRIDFHTDLQDKIAYCCRLARKAHASGARLIIVGQREELAALDAALWTFSERDFIPHVALSDPLAAATPIVLSAQGDAEFPHHQVLVNLGREAPAHFARFERLIELVGSEEAERAAGRERYRHYRERGYPLEHRKVGA